jgi:hypothetical protein
MLKLSFFPRILALSGVEQQRGNSTVNAPNKSNQVGHGNLDYKMCYRKSDYYKRIMRFERLPKGDDKSVNKISPRVGLFHLKSRTNERGKRETIEYDTAFRRRGQTDNLVWEIRLRE